MASPFVLEDHMGNFMGLDSVRGTMLAASSQYDQQIGRFQRVSPTGGAMVAISERLVGGGFPPGSVLDTVSWTTAASGAGSAATVGGNMVTLTSGTANSGYATLTNNFKARFLYASANLLRGTFRLPTLLAANNSRVWGAFNFGAAPAVLDGYYFSFDGNTGLISVNVANGGVVTSVASGSFN